MARRPAALGCAAVLGALTLATWGWFTYSGFTIFRAVTAGPVPHDEQAWFTAARKGEVAALQSGLDRGTPIDAPERHHGRTALMRAAFFGHRAAVEMLLAAKADPGAEDLENATALDLAAAAGERDIVGLLARAGADVNRKKEPDGRTALYTAVEAKQADAVRALLDAGADPNLGNQDLSPLERAIDDANAEVVTLLLARGAKAVPSGGQRGRDGLLLRAVDTCQDADPAIIAALARAGADSAAADGQGKTALYWARYFVTRPDRRVCSQRQLDALVAAGVTR